MKLSIVINITEDDFKKRISKNNLEKKLEKIKSLGYKGIELAILNPTLLDSKKLEKIINNYKLDVPAIATGKAYSQEGLSLVDSDVMIREMALNRLKDHIDFASIFSSKVIIGLIRGKVEGKVGYKQAMNWLITSLNKCLDFALKKNVMLIFEPINRYETNLINDVDNGLHLIKKINNKNLGLLLDTFHMNIEEPSIESSIEKARNHIFHFHIADSNRWYPGAGHLDFKAIIKSLKNVGYDGYLSAEILPMPDENRCVINTINYFKKMDI